MIRRTSTPPTPTIPNDIASLLSSPRPDLTTWKKLCDVVDRTQPDTTTSRAIGQTLASTWPRELPRPAPRAWIQARKDTHGNRTLFYDYLDHLCLHVVENEALYNHYITSISSHPQLRGDDGMPIVSLWRQPRGVVTLQGGGQITLGAGQPGLADIGGVMTVTPWKGTPTCGCGGTSAPSFGKKRCPQCRYEAQAPHSLNLYVEVEVKTDGNIPPGANEYRGTSKRALTDTERDQVARQQAQCRRGGFYVFAERVSEAVDALCRYRDDVLARVV